jgi:hypothetical protein
MVSTPSRWSEPSTAWRMCSGRLEAHLPALLVEAEPELGGDDHLVADTHAAETDRRDLQVTVAKRSLLHPVSF